MGGRPAADSEVIAAPAWQEITRMGLRGLVMIVGGADTGKSTLARWLLRRLTVAGATPVAFLDGDPGQSSLGPPATVTLAILSAEDGDSPGSGRRWRRFIGSTSPREHMLPLLAGIARLVEVARIRRFRTVLYDTTGLIDPTQGGTALKLAKIELLRPEILIAIQRRSELEPLLGPLRRSARTRLIELVCPPDLPSRSTGARQRYRAKQFAAHFAGSRILELDLSHFAVMPQDKPEGNRLVAFEDAAGFTRALGIAVEPAGASGKVAILTPLRNLAPIDAIRQADLWVDPVSFRDRPISPVNKGGTVASR